MGVPIETGAQGFTAVPSGSLQLLTLAGVPDRGTIVRAVVVQTSGEADGFGVALYSSRDAFNAAGTALSTISELYRVTPNFSATGPAVFARTEWGASYPWENRDRFEADGTPRLRRPNLYLALTASGSAAKNYVVNLCVLRPEL